MTTNYIHFCQSQLTIGVWMKHNNFFYAQHQTSLYHSEISDVYLSHPVSSRSFSPSWTLDPTACAHRSWRSWTWTWSGSRRTTTRWTSRAWPPTSSTPWAKCVRRSATRRSRSWGRTPVTSYLSSSMFSYLSPPHAPSFHSITCVSLNPDWSIFGLPWHTSTLGNSTLKLDSLNQRCSESN